MDKSGGEMFGLDRIILYLKPYIVIFAAAITVYGLIYTFSAEFNMLSRNWWNNYSRQSQSWLEGRLDLPENIAYLEIAFFNDKNYISFPPFPSVVMLPIVAVYGYDTPDHVVAFVFALISLIFAYKIAENLLKDRMHAVFFSLFLILGTNYLHISLWGSVWYIAQNMAFAFTLIAFYYALTDKKWHSVISLFALCCAMGCRPFNTLYMPLIFYLIYRREGLPLFGFTKKLAVYAIPAVILGMFYMWLNYARFGNIFEFGHNYLPEFTIDPLGQFHPSRIMGNLRMMFVDTDMSYQIFNGFPFYQRVGFAFWLASPILVSYLVYLGYKAYRTVIRDTRITDHTTWMIPILVTLHLFLFTLHRTLGGRQFGSRYAADSLPAIFLGLMFILSKMKLDNRVYYNAVPMVFGLLINFHGSIMFFSFYFG
jgi:hypothetical protein